MSGRSWQFFWLYVFLRFFAENLLATAKEFAEWVTTLIGSATLSDKPAWSCTVSSAAAIWRKSTRTALCTAFGKSAWTCSLRHALQVRDEDGTVLGDYFADLFVGGRLIVEIKASRALADEHTAQLLCYLRASQVEHGLLMNFGGGRFEIRKFILSISTQSVPRRTAGEERH